MKGGLTIEQMKFLVAKGLDASDMIAFAEMGAAKSKGAERIARWRARKAAAEAGETPEGVTNSVTCNALHPPKEDHTPLVSSNDEIEPRRKPAKPKRVEAISCPEGVRPTVWADFKRLRAKKGGGVSLTALEGIAAEAKKAGWTLDAALAEAVTRNWQGFKAEWVAAAPVANDPGDSLVAKILARQARGP